MDNIISTAPIVSYWKQTWQSLTGSGAASGKSVDIQPVEVHEIEDATEKRPRTLKHLLKANHVNHSIIYHDLQFDNHLPHILCAAYHLGANENQLNHIYDVESKVLEPWQLSPSELSDHDWRDHLGDKRYQRSYLDFFEDKLVVDHSYKWKGVVEEFMFGGDEPLGNCLIGGLGHPLIHQGYAYEFDSKEMATEALGMAAVQYDFLHKYLDDASYSKPPPSPSDASTSPLDLLTRMADDKRLKGIFPQPGYQNIELLFKEHEEIVIEYWNAWKIEDPIRQFQASQEAAVALLVATVAPGTHAYNFFKVHLLTTSHAVRILLPFVPTRFHMSLIRQWWLLAIAVYMAELCPKIDPDYIKDPGQTQWNYVENKALTGPYATDAHFVKAVRAMKEAARTWGDLHNRYLAAAVRFVDDFSGWEFE